MLQDNRRQASSSSAVGNDDTIDLVGLVGAIWRGKFTILLFVLSAMLLGGVYAFVVATPTYRATTSLALEVEGGSILNIDAIIPGMSSDDQTLNTEIEVLQSRGILKQLVARLDLTADPEFNTALLPPPIISLDQIAGGIVDTVLGPEDVVLDPGYDPEATALNDTISALRDAIYAEIHPETYVINIWVTTESAAKSQEIANTLAEIYIADQIDQEFAATETAVTWLSERVAELEMELLERENAMKSMRTEIDLISIEGLEALNRQFIDARERAEAAAADVALTEARQEQIAELRAAGNYEQLAEILDDPTLSNLVEGDADSEAIEARLDVLAARVDANLTRQLQQLQTLQDSVARLEGEVEAQSEDLVRLQQIEREVQATRTLYETFLTRLKEATVQRGLAQADSRVLSEAIPGQYISPKKPLILALSLILGAGLGITVVLVRQFLNRGFRSAEELENETALPIFGQIPIMPFKRRDQLISYLNDKPSSAAVEAIRNLRTSLLLSTSDAPPQIIMSTSSLPAEGKTTMAISLAHNLGGLNKKVLLIEGDVRRRTLNSYFKGQVKVKGGLISAMRAESMDGISNFLVRDPRMDVDILLGEKSPQNAADLFSSDRFEDFLSELRKHYDHVVIDTPPVLVVPDARVIGQHADTIVFNVAWNRTSRVQVKEALRLLRTANLSADGMVLGQIDPAGMKRYGYGGKYGSYAGYDSGYYDT
ncbi:capsular exopolysaccharide family [Palleronia marisminoris]|uniref:non-specific protein-tyrosine kinase n=1 Tax=Palleronia marisminoris TaxID=315423 RepID=A0A1Y5TRC3_9RHOB|nr:Wzz/FepE/Etk N-terminal domain-containing protein [Palleronia marisminoris]SFH50133.1 capsular exopolysaccharide family [Palleronia marisminoris]SLN70325.1 Tyrosine-protein kinase wzc [Palleronia marisminoris]